MEIILGYFSGNWWSYVGGFYRKILMILKFCKYE